MKAAAIVAAAGSGRRMKNNTRKQYLYLEGVPVLARSIKLFLDCSAINTVVVVIPDGEEDEVKRLIEPYCSFNKLFFTAGGETRQQSGTRGLAVLPAEAELVCIHDAARPLASSRLLENLLGAAAEFGAAVPVIRLSDTVKEVDEKGLIIATPRRESLRLVQTPQVFKRSLIEEAYRLADENGFEATDDAALIEAAGLPVKTVPGEEKNFKITTPLDLAFAELLLKGEAIK